MSRRAPAKPDVQVAALQKELQDLKRAAVEHDATQAPAEPNTAEFDQLSPTEQAAGSLGVHPEAWKPIAFMNASHYKQLIEANMLDDDLARRIEAYRQVAQTSS